ncbi:MAG: biotin carboxylase N-terminal domain-containing protein [Acidimicrobiales bacterium]
MLKKLLIANRGEIAVRVARACRELGIASVAVYSDADRGAMHVRMADEAYSLGGTTAAESYLDANKLLGVLKRSGADSVHPGYGFFAENADFARSVMSAGATWVGPPPEAIEVMGDKVSSRLAARRAGLAPVPGTFEALSGPEEVAAFGNAQGWPVAIKATFGGGGRGMRVVTSPDEVQAALESAQREAASAFGRPECYLEKYLPWPRHVEVQIFADAHGNIVHLGTRDCSVQRRHQKLVEEAPAPGLPEPLLAAMGEAAVGVARACGYVGAGTVELIYQDGDFYFLEMNTRLQVEHPVTEMVTGTDLVQLQLRVASGEQLGFSQEDVKLRGHAIEARVNAEDPSGGAFVPSPGRLEHLSTADGPWVRTDAGYQTGDEVSQFYDNLIAKVVVWGPDRESARRRLLRALHETQVEGVATTIPAQMAVLSHEDFISVGHSTTWLETRVKLPDVFPAAERLVTASPELAVGRRSATERNDVEVEVDGRRYVVSVWAPPPAQPPGPAGLARKVPGAGQVARSGSGRSVPERTSAVGARGGQVTVPMQGTVVKVLVQPGDAVEPGQPVCVLEAMKMENNIVSQVAGTVVEVRVAPGALVGTGDVVAVVAPPE